MRSAWHGKERERLCGMASAVSPGRGGRRAHPRHRSIEAHDHRRHGGLRQHMICRARRGCKPSVKWCRRDVVRRRESGSQRAHVRESIPAGELLVRVLRPHAVLARVLACEVREGATS